MARKDKERQVPLSPEEESFLRAFARALITVPRALDADLLRLQGLGMNEYAVLMHLSEAADTQLRMSDLAAMTALSVSGVTRIVARLEHDGLVRREQCSTDARGWNAVLTEQGLDRLRDAWPSHLASVRRHVFDHVDPTKLKTFTEMLMQFAPDEDAGDRRRR